MVSLFLFLVSFLPFPHLHCFTPPSVHTESRKIWWRLGQIISCLDSRSFSGFPFLSEKSSRPGGAFVGMAHHVSLHLLLLFSLLTQLQLHWPSCCFLKSPDMLPPLGLSSYFLWASLVAQRLKHLPTMWETWVQSLGWEGPLEKEMVTHSRILAWRIPWTEEPGGLQSTGSQRVRRGWVI